MVYRGPAALSDEARAALLRAGWRADRSIDITPYASFLARWGLPLVEPAADTLRRFGGLRIACASEGVLTVDPLEALGAVEVFEDLEWVRILGDRLDEVITPLARATRSGSVLVQGASARLYVEREGWIGVAGNTSEAALDVIIRGLVIPPADALPVPEDEWG